MARMCAGMSGREISKLGVAWQAAVYASENGVLTEKMVMERCEAAAVQHKQKVYARLTAELILFFIYEKNPLFRWRGYRIKKKETTSQSQRDNRCRHHHHSFQKS